MSSINNIVKKLRESRLSEVAGPHRENIYHFRIPWRQQISFIDDSEYQTNYKYMDYGDDIMRAAEKDFNEAELGQYFRDGSFKIKSMEMYFNDIQECIIVIETNRKLVDDEINILMNYISGQMSDGWGEGFEQREIARFPYETEEWVEDEEDENGGYYDTWTETALIYGQFWWHDGTTPWEVSWLKGEVTTESRTSEGVDSTGEGIKEGTSYKRIASTSEFDNGHVIFGDWKKMSDEEAEELAKQKSIEDPSKVFYVKYDDIMNPCSDIKWKNGEMIDESKLSEKTESPIKEFPTEEEAEEYAKDNGLEIDKTQITRDGCKVWFKMRESPEYLSSFSRDVMREVNAEAPSALHWKNGTLVRRAGTNYTAVFKGYKRDGLGRLKAVIDHDGEIVEYSLEDLQRDIENSKLFKLSAQFIKESSTSPSQFKVGDNVEFSMLYGGIVRAEVVSRDEKILTLKEKWTSEDDGSEASDTTDYKIEVDDRGSEYIVVWEYHGEKGKVYPPEDVKESEKLEEDIKSTEKDDVMQELLGAVQTKLFKFMTSPKIGYLEDEVKEYTRVDVEYLKKEKAIKVEVGAELSYESLSDLCDELNPIVFSYDEDSYFEPEQPGIIVAYLSVDSDTPDYTSEEYIVGTIDPAVSAVVSNLTGNGFDDSSYSYNRTTSNSGVLKAQGVVYLKKGYPKNIWEKLEVQLDNLLNEHGYEDCTIYHINTEDEYPDAPFTSYRLYFRAYEKEED